MFEFIIGFALGVVVGVVVGGLFYRRHQARIEAAAQKVKAAAKNVSDI